MIDFKLSAIAGAAGLAVTLLGIALWNAPSQAAVPGTAAPAHPAQLNVPLPWLPWQSDELLEPRTFQSDHGVLSVLMVAHASPINVFSNFRSTGWTYQICPRPADGSERCPRGSSTDNEYGGTRLQVDPGETLKILLVNKLPFFTLPTDPHAPVNPGARGRSQNPTSLHTHGLLVSPHYALPGESVWGDNPFARVFNVANGAAPPFEKMMGPVLNDHIDYQYDVPSTHPSGLFWFHPHAHGLTQAQITSGLSGVLTVGHVADEICQDATCRTQLAQIPERHLLLKDSQIEADGSIALDQDTGFCAVDDSPGSSPREHTGGCDGQPNSPVSGQDHTGGRWYYTINGQDNPSLTVGMPTGQVWRLVNASGNTTYDLNLYVPGERRQMEIQVLSVNGASLGTADRKSTAQLKAREVMTDPVSCPTGVGVSRGLCTFRLHVMPATRIELWVGYRDVNGNPVRRPTPTQAIFRTNGFSTGPSGDNYPAIDLAKVDFAYGQVDLQGDGRTSARTGNNTIVQAAGTGFHTQATKTNCAPLAPGHMRRIFLNLTQPSPAKFGIGYEELDQNGRPVPGTFSDVKVFDHMDAPLCLSLNPGNQPEVERWQLVNLAEEDHSFHVHQVQFSVVDAPAVDGTVSPKRIGMRPQMIDTLALQHADGECDSVADWRNGRCSAHVATIEIPFKIAGDFLFHCHVLEHEDGGMMAGIRVLPNPGTTTAASHATR